MVRELPLSAESAVGVALVILLDLAKQAEVELETDVRDDEGLLTRLRFTRPSKTGIGPDM